MLSSMICNALLDNTHIRTRSKVDRNSDMASLGGRNPVEMEFSAGFDAATLKINALSITANVHSAHCLLSSSVLLPSDLCVHALFMCANLPSVLAHAFCAGAHRCHEAPRIHRMHFSQRIRRPRRQPQQRNFTFPANSSHSSPANFGSHPRSFTSPPPPRTPSCVRRVTSRVRSSPRRPWSV
jgi:hypothetical protein